MAYVKQINGYDIEDFESSNIWGIDTAGTGDNYVIPYTKSVTVDAKQGTNITKLSVSKSEDYPYIQTTSTNNSLEVVTKTNSVNRWIWVEGQDGDWLCLGAGTGALGNAGLHFSTLDKSTNGWMVYWDQSTGKPVFPQSTVLANGFTAPNQTTYTTSTTQIANDSFVQGAINRRIPKTVNISATKTDSSYDGTTLLDNIVYNTIWTNTLGSGFAYVYASVRASAGGSPDYFRAWILHNGSDMASSRVGCRPTLSGQNQLSPGRVIRLANGDKIGVTISVNGTISGNITIYLNGVFFAD